MCYDMEVIYISLPCSRKGEHNLKLKCLIKSEVDRCSKTYIIYKFDIIEASIYNINNHERILKKIPKELETDEVVNNIEKEIEKIIEDSFEKLF